MADETEASGPGLRIENEQQFKQWLEETRPAPDVCVALAARAALRTVPFILHDVHYKVVDEALQKLVLGMFRTCATLWIAVRHSVDNNNYSIDIIAAVTSILVENSFLRPKNHEVIWAAANAALSTIQNQTSLRSNELDAAKFYTRVLHAVENSITGILISTARNAENDQTASGNSYLNFNTFNRGQDCIWRMVERDVSLISSGANARSLAGTYLWHDELPKFVSRHWRGLADALPNSDDWWVWKNWYEDRLYGKQKSEAHDLIYATVPVEEWDKSPAVANAWIADRLAELEKDPPDHIIESFEKLIAQDPHGAPFEIVEGKARIAASLDENDARVAENPQTIQLHDRVKIRANSARERVRRLANQPGFESIAATVEEFYSYISGDTLSVAANISTVWELSVAIGSFIERDDEIRAGRGGLVSEMDADARETLDQLVIASAPFVRRFPTARQNDDDVRLFKQSRESFKPAKQIFEQAIKDNLIEESSKAVIAAALNSAEISSGIQSEKSRSWIENSARNLARFLFTFVVLSGGGFGAFVGATFANKVIEDFYDHSQSGPVIREFLLEKENEIIHLFSELPQDLRATIRETYRRLKKI